ncbi:hypothetical protein SAMN05421869_112334 [Nonomuraea jiangxiensis]|uniref:Uncharacterized protein n=1 Tax=Nonomuraea jiangxiensis TaxID=633440 RepID=A0A1G8X509_9ACTN|nr:hypothetical protein SAMN05421869_112334 [Nonomuraea jiangxiensis]
MRGSQRLLRCLLLLQLLGEPSNVVRIDRLAEAVIHFVLG